MKKDQLHSIISNASKKIAPAWPLKNFVAVNPYLGLSDMPFKKAAEVLSERGGINMGMSKFFYLNKIEEGVILDPDIKKALNHNGISNLSVKDFIKEARFLSISTSVHTKFKYKTAIDVVEQNTQKHWNEFMIDKISSWASSYFDEIQALWKSSNESNDLFLSWKTEAEIDASTEIMGINNFRSILKAIPNDSMEATNFVLNKLEVYDESAEAYLHTLLLKVLGWSSFISGVDWDNGLYSSESKHLQSFLSIIICWEYCLFESLKDKSIKFDWAEARKSFYDRTQNHELDEYLDVKMVLQDAYDFSHQRSLAKQFMLHNEAETIEERPKAQAVFCIDVRSEVYRRNLEAVDAEFETFGFAGFFGFSIDYVPMGHDKAKGKKLCPALIPASAVVKEALPTKNQTIKAVKERESKHQFKKIWKSFKAGAVSSFGYVSPMGLSFLPKLIGDSYSLTRPETNPKIDGVRFLKKNHSSLDLSEISLEEKVGMAASALTAMNLGTKMAPLVLITGHGSTSVNNPHATGLDCGACGGNSGDINAMTAEIILNDPQVRASLTKAGINVPDDTHFIACLHDTTTDEITLIGEKNVPTSHQDVLKSVKISLEKASKLARQERAFRLGITKGEKIDQSIFKRSKDWSQVRPEWGLAGCSSFIIAPRAKTKGLNLEGKSFLQSYDWKTDDEFKILESIMTAPMVVTSWINLQYFASTTDNERLGAGNKTLHNITSGVGVLEGSSGDLRIGLPLQSVHDGTDYQHLPMRLKVVIAAPTEAIASILNKHKNVKDLLDNEWISLLILNENGKLSKRYIGDNNWEDISSENVVFASHN